MIRKLIPILLIVFSFTIHPLRANAQDYSYTVPNMSVDAYWNEDGSLSLEYTFVFTNDNWGHPIEYVDLGLPNGDFDTTRWQPGL